MSEHYAYPNFGALLDHLEGLGYKVTNREIENKHAPLADQRVSSAKLHLDDVVLDLSVFGEDQWSWSVEEEETIEYDQGPQLATQIKESDIFIWFYRQRKGYDANAIERIDKMFEVIKEEI